MKQTNFDVYNNRDLFLQNIERLSKGKVVRVLDTNMFKFDVFKILVHLTYYFMMVHMKQSIVGRF